MWLRGGVFWTLSNLQIGTFLMELWWPRKLPELPWIHLGSSWVNPDIFIFFYKNNILDIIFDTFRSGKKLSSNPHVVPLYVYEL